MNKSLLIGGACVLLGLLWACKEEVYPQDPSRSKGYQPEWLISEHRVLEGGPGKDGIPALDHPSFVPASVADLVGPELVIGLKIGEDVRAYPHKILDWHEIVNDSVGGDAVSITYCPLTGTAVCWSRNLKLGVTTFGVSGLLYNSNLIPYDRETDSEWSQLLFKSVHGPNIGDTLRLFPIVETTWENWQSMYPNTLVLSSDTGYPRPYGAYPYGNYRESQNQLLFPIVPVDGRLPFKERVHGVIIDDSARVFRFRHFADGIRVVNDSLQGQPIVTAGSEAHNFFVSYGRRLPGGRLLHMELAEGPLPRLFKDQEGNVWDVFGYAIEGPRMGSQLPFYPSFVGFWMAFGAFYPEPVIFEE